MSRAEITMCFAVFTLSPRPRSLEIKYLGKDIRVARLSIFFFFRFSSAIDAFQNPQIWGLLFYARGTKKSSMYTTRRVSCPETTFSLGRSDDDPACFMSAPRVSRAHFTKSDFCERPRLLSAVHLPCNGLDGARSRRFRTSTSREVAGALKDSHTRDIMYFPK